VGARKCMERFYKTKAPQSGNARNSCHLDDINREEEIKYDPSLRKETDSYHPNQREGEKEISGKWKYMKEIKSNIFKDLEILGGVLIIKLLKV